MEGPEVINPLPVGIKVVSYPGLISVAVAIFGVSIILFVSKKFDPTGGQLTISVMVVLAFIGVVAICMLFTIPNDEITGASVGGLIAAFSAVVVHWLGRPRPPPT